MFELSQEEVIMSADDRSIVLTTHRVIQYTDKGKVQIMLEDFENYEFKSAHVGNYENLTFFFISTTLLITINRAFQYFNSPYELASFSEFMSSSFLIYPSLLLLIISLFFYLASRRYLIRING